MNEKLQIAIKFIRALAFLDVVEIDRTFPNLEGLRLFLPDKQLPLPKDSKEFSSLFPKDSVVTVIDRLLVSYSFVGLADSVLAIGPYRTKNLRRFEAMERLKECHVSPSLLQAYIEYYNALPHQSEENARIIAQTTLFALNREDCNISERSIDMSTQKNILVFYDTPDDVQLSVENIESRHSLEDFYLSQITRGNFTTAYSAFQKLFRQSSPQIEKMNKEGFTILRSITRIAARRSGVPAASLHMLTEAYKNRVNNAQNPDEIEILTKKFISDICAIVRRYATLRYSQPIRQAIEYIWRNLNTSITLDTLAGEIGISPAWLSRKFHQETGRTLTSFITQERMRSAAEYLAFTDMSINEISSAVGIPDSNYFTKLFKKVYGIVPKEFRKNPQYDHPLLKTDGFIEKMW